jgi:hypothetical protein
VQTVDQNQEVPMQQLSAPRPFALEEARQTVQAGGRIVFYEYCISFGLVTLRRPSRVYLLRRGSKGLVRGIPYTLFSLLLGWWGVPWGLIYTPLTWLTNLSGGLDITAQLRPLLFSCPPEEPAGAASRQGSCSAD